MPQVKPPYPGQGSPLPESMGLNGAWIIENLAAITIDEPSTPDGDGLFQRAPISPLGNNVFTIDASLLAKNLELTVESLFTENRAGRLLFDFVNAEIGPNFVAKFMCNAIEYHIAVEPFREQ